MIGAMAQGTDSKTSRPPKTDLYDRAYAGMDSDAGRGLGDDAGVLWRITRLALRHRARVGLAVVATVVAAVFQLTIPTLLGDAVDGALALLRGRAPDREAARAALVTAALLILGASMARGFFTLIHNYCGETTGHLLAYDLRRQFYDKLQRLGFGFHDRVHTGDLITRGILDMEGVRAFMNTGFLRVFQLTVLVGAGAWLMLRTDLVLGALALSFVPYVVWRSASARLRLRRLWFLLQDKMGALGLIMDENLTGIRVVRAFAAEPYEMRRYAAASDEAMGIADERIRTRVSSTTMMTFTYFVSMGLVLWAGGQRVLDGRMTVGTLTEFLAFMTILQLPVRQLGLVINSFARASTCGSRLFAVLDLEPAVRDAPGAKPLRLSEGTLRFEDVSFTYHGEGAPPVLHNVSFELRRGHALGIVGPPGSGKSTLAHLLPRYYDVTGGRITIDGQDIRDITLDSLRGAVGVLSQDPFLFTASLENNIAYGDPWAEEDAIREAAGAAQIGGFIAGLPEGFETLVGERGVSLSGGQKQRVAIARSALLSPPILVLDDSTAAIDAGTERQIRLALRDRAADTATIIISHRLSALRHADEILFLENGRVAERGSHDALLAQDGRYAALYRLQSLDSVAGGAQAEGAAE
jgi:ATP-binding cassette subfamily B multidrug efflux pump